MGTDAMQADAMRAGGRTPCNYATYASMQLMQVWDMQLMQPVRDIDLTL